jgi:hypothetical protein
MRAKGAGGGLRAGGLRDHDNSVKLLALSGPALCKLYPT